MVQNGNGEQRANHSPFLLADLYLSLGFFLSLLVLRLCSPVLQTSLGRRLQQAVQGRRHDHLRSCMEGRGLQASDRGSVVHWARCLVAVCMCVYSSKILETLLFLQFAAPPSTLLSPLHLMTEQTPTIQWEATWREKIVCNHASTWMLRMFFFSLLLL